MAIHRFFLFTLLLAALALPGQTRAQDTGAHAQSTPSRATGTKTDSAARARVTAIRDYLHAHSADSVAIRGRIAAIRDSLRTHGVDSVTSRARITAFWNALLYHDVLDGRDIHDARAIQTAQITQIAQAAHAAHAVDSAALRARMTVGGASVARGADSLARLRDSLGRDSARIAAGGGRGAGTTGTAGTTGPSGTAASGPSAKPSGPAPDTRLGTPKVSVSQDLLFYVLLAMLIWMGILKSGYEKYYSDLFTVFFRSSLRQHQIREQLLQARLPSLLYNLFFVGCAGTFLYLIAAQHAVRMGTGSQWELWLASVGAVALLYVAKFLGLKLSGWIFGMSGAVDTYIFIVFLVNKILGVALLPIVILLAFSKEPIQSAAATLGILLVAGMLVYRFIRSYRPVWEEVQMSRFHFFLYLCTFEIAPLLLIYKSMLKLL